MSSPPNVSIQENSEQLASDGVTLILEWTQENSHLPFHHDINNIIPQGATARFIDDTSIELTMPYNVSFNVSITIRLCNRTLLSTIFTLPVYTKASLICDAPVLQPNVQAIVNYSQLLIEGTTLMFTCLPGLTLSGPNTTTCLGNGQWIPNPDLIKCKGVSKP
ncbi:MAG: CCP domain-containing protein [Proteobacteria bacterium]|nr:CCP domain-containing protein [Pseudomonadota bacterium]